jgi:hypothetical protein
MWANDNGECSPVFYSFSLLLLFITLNVDLSGIHQWGGDAEDALLVGAT